MNIRTDIICSESDIDLKDKVAMDETELPKQPNSNVVDINSQSNADEKTLADLIKNSQDVMKGCSVTGKVSVVPIGIPTHLITKPSKYISYSQVLGQVWVVPTNEIEDSIVKYNNPRGYVYIQSYSQLSKLPAILVLCEEIKNSFNDGSFKISYNPITHENVKRMTE